MQGAVGHWADDATGGASGSPPARRTRAGTFERLLPAGESRGLSRPDGHDFGLTQLRASRRARHRYAISVIAIGIKGRSMGVSQRGVATMVDRVGRRMKQQSSGRITFRFRDWIRTPKVAAQDLSCDVDRLYERYGGYAPSLRRTPRGYTDAIALMITPLRRQCRFAGSALLGGDATYLNGVFLAGSQRLQDWITAHEIGHNLGLVHSGSFVPSAPGWSIAADAVPQNERSHTVDEYGDYLDLMGAPPSKGRRVVGADYSRWTLDAISQLHLGSMDDGDVQIVETSGNYDLAALRPGGLPGAVSAVAIPVVADGTATFWVLEYRPPEQNLTGPGYPPPWDATGYGVRLILYEHLSRRWYHINKTLHLGRGPSAAAALPTVQPIRLGGGARLTVAAVSSASATIAVTLSGDEFAVPDGSPPDGAAPDGGPVAWPGS